MKDLILRILKTPLSYIFCLFYFIASFYKAKHAGTSIVDPIFSFILFGIIFPLTMLFITRKSRKISIQIKDTNQEFFISILYFCFWLILFMVFGKTLLSNNFLSNGFGFWGLLVLIPLIYLWLRGYRHKDFGISKTFLWQNLRIAILACLIIGPVLLLLTPGGKYLLTHSFSATSLLTSILIALAYGFVFAGFFEEFFFRAVLQTRFSHYFKSHIRGIFLASLIFGIYHLPFQYFGEGTAQGDILLSLAHVFSEQMIAAPIFGILWARTNNLLAPVLLHSFIDGMSMLPQLLDKIN